MMEDFNSETDSDYTSYWRDWYCWRGDGLGCSSQDMGRGCPHDAIAAGENIEASPKELAGAHFTSCASASSYHASHQPSPS
ncbi:hypothetical protein IFM47457_04394 [Aspergillus lentulus]|nr:hypothetical protein IFM47457_04394 [Aspergillus lentulus]